MSAETSGEDARDVTIRAYSDADWPAVCAVHDRARPDELRGSCDLRAFVPLAEEKDDADNFQRSRKYVACIGEQVVGFVGVDGTYLSWLYVDPDHYGQGIGRRLLRLGMELTGSQAWTVVLQGNTRALRLYEREGFQVAHTYEGTNAGYPCTCLRLALSPASARSPDNGRENPEEAGDRENPDK